MTSPLPLQRPISAPLPAETPVAATPGAGQKLGAAGIAEDALAAVSLAPVPEAYQAPAPRPAEPAIAGPLRRPAVLVRYDAKIRPIPRKSSLARAPIGQVAQPAPVAATAPVAAPASVAALAPAPMPALDQPSTGLVATSPPVYRVRMPLKRPKSLRRPASAQVIPAAAPTRTKPNTAAVGVRKGGKICGDRRIRGRTMSPIKGRLAGCGIAQPVLVSEVAGIPLSRPATLDCAAARALTDWVETGVKPAIGRYGGGLSELKVVASYSCRTRNNKKGAKLSEHAKGKAVDVAAFELKKGGSLDLLSDWRTKKEGAILKKIHKAACGPFGTVLGPNADRYHQNHLHMDVARYRSGPYCR